ncbi:MAG: phage holin family protein [Cyclobacteriaceae bacterium]
MSLINNVIDRITDYLKVKGEKLKLDIIASVSRIMAYVISFILILLIGFFFLVFASITTGALINEALESAYLGYLIISGFYLIVLVVVLMLLKTRKIQNLIEKTLVHLNDAEL